MEAELLRGALIGTGSIAPYHLTAWQRVPGVQIVALCNRTIEKAQALGERFHIPASHIYQDFEDLLAREPNLNFVDIATAPALHRAQTELAAEHGLHVLCQKPLAPSLRDAQAMLDACQAAGVLLTVNENWRWRGWYRAVRQHLQQGTLGRLRYVRISSHHNVTLERVDGSRPPLFDRQAYTRDLPQLLVFEWGIQSSIPCACCSATRSGSTPTWPTSVRCAPARGPRLDDAGFWRCGLPGLELGRPRARRARPRCWKRRCSRAMGAAWRSIPNHGDGDCLRLVRRLPHERVPVDRRRAWSPVVTQVWPAHDGDIAGAYQASYDAAHRHFVESLRAGRLPETHAADNLKPCVPPLPPTNPPLKIG